MFKADAARLAGERQQKTAFDLVAMLPDDVGRDFIARTTTRHYGRGQLIYGQGDKSQEMYRLTSGLVRLAHIDPTGRDVVYSYCRPDCCFGYCSLIDGHGLPHTAEARTDAQIQVLDLKAFDALRLAHPVIDRMLLILVLQYMRSVNRNVASVMLETLPVRLARRLLAVALPDAAGTPTVELPQSELGAMVGATRQSVNKVLREFQKQKLVHITYGAVRLRNVRALQHRASSALPSPG